MESQCWQPPQVSAQHGRPELHASWGVGAEARRHRRELQAPDEFELWLRLSTTWGPLSQAAQRGFSVLEISSDTVAGGQARLSPSPQRPEQEGQRRRGTSGSRGRSEASEP
eukprot:364287-Chlamydomonas_euryale.AAC.13